MSACRGGTCDSPTICDIAGRCTYRSSADEAREVMSSQKVEDFAGVVDGLGVKSVMKSPKSGTHLIDPAFILGVGNVLTYGASKYAANNWMRGMSWSVVFGAILRHLLAWFMGEDNDKESGLPHLHHAACSLMFLGYYARNTAHHQFDDRGFR